MEECKIPSGLFGKRDIVPRVKDINSEINPNIIDFNQ